MSEATIYINTNTLRSDIYAHDSIKNALHNFLCGDKNRILNILVKKVDDQELATHRLIHHLSDFYNSQFYLYHTEGDRLTNCLSSFAVADASYFILSKETNKTIEEVKISGDGTPDPMDRNANKRIWSIVNFGDVETANRLNVLFSEYVATRSRESQLDIDLAESAS